MSATAIQAFVHLGAGYACVLDHSRLGGGAMKLRMLRVLLLAAWRCASPAALVDFSSVVIFGDSLSDTGNNAFVFDTLGALGFLPPSELRTPYRLLATRYPNCSLSAVASNLGGTDYAYGGARIGPLGSSLNPFVDFPNNFPLSVTSQVATFLGQHPQAPGDALYIVEGGGNDARDIIQKAAQDIGGGNQPAAGHLSRCADVRELREQHRR